ncbi:MAG: copper-translocating P-type ATPase [Phycisphaeraceae bacterium]|nr:copper-translocating P-type ATPase [Phycisphaeraceae bacterium]
MTQTLLNVQGMRCAGCVASVEKNLCAVPGVETASVNLATGQAMVRGEVPAPRELVRAVERAGFTAELVEQDDAASPHGHAHHEQAHEQDHGRPHGLIVGGVLAAVVFFLGMAWPMLAGDHAGSGLWSLWTQFVLAAVVQAWLGMPFYRGAYKALRHGRAEMDTLVAMGTTVAFGYSAAVTIWVTIRSPEHPAGVYYDSAVMILVLVGLGRWLEARARGSAAAAIRGLMQLQPARATVIRQGQETEVPLSAVRVGDELLVRPGERVPTDGQVIDGRSEIDRSMVTGESLPTPVGPGDAVVGGTINQGGAFRMTAQRLGGQTLLSQIIRLVQQAQASKAHVQRLADAISGVFVPVVIAVSALALLGWGVYGDWDRGLFSMIAVLIVACPCALGLATPTAIMVGTGLGAREGILIKDAAALERAGKLTHIILDKTGTLTMGRLTVSEVAAIEGKMDRQEVLSLAASVEVRSEHPLGRAVVRQARNEGLELAEVENFERLDGGGVTGRVKGRYIVIGRMAALREREVRGLETLTELREKLEEQAGRTFVAVSVDAEAVGWIAFADELKPGADAVVAELHELGLQTILMTGDQRLIAEHVARPLGIDEIWSDVLPQDKHAKVVELQGQGAMVAMVGDGINDAPALAAADLGVAMAAGPWSAEHAEQDGQGEAEQPPPANWGGTDIAMAAGQVVLVGGDLALIPRAIRLSRATLRRIYTGLFWAFVYNLVLIPLAAWGYLHPMLAAAAMSLSSASVVGNALWLRYRGIR